MELLGFYYTPEYFLMEDTQDLTLTVKSALFLEPVQYLFKVRKKWYNGINKTIKAVK